MTRLVDNRPPRSMKLIDDAATTVQRRSLIVVQPEFFAQRDDAGRLEAMPISDRVFSTELRDIVLERWDDLVLISRNERDRSWLEIGFENHDEKVELFDIDPMDLVVSTQRVIELIMLRWTARLTLPKNHRTVSYLNLHRFIQCSSLQFAHTTSHLLLSVPVPKEKTFLECAKEREHNGW